MVMIKCDYCGKELSRTPYQINRSKHHFCSKKCKGLYKRNKVKVKCDYCGKEFLKYKCEVEKGLRKGHTHNYCSKECYKKTQLKKPPDKICKSCGKLFSVTSQTNINEFCCKRCFHDYNTKDRIECICEECGKKFYMLESVAKYRKYCSQKCKYIALSRENSLREHPKGSNHPSYKTGIGSYRHQALDMLPNECIVCGKTDCRLVVHHIDENREHNPEDCSNWVVMCRSCHNKWHRGTLNY